MDEYWKLQQKMRERRPRQQMFMLDGNHVGRSPQHQPPLLLISDASGTAYLLIDSNSRLILTGV